MSRFVPQMVKDAFAPVQKPVYKSKCSFATLGTVGAGKTTWCGLTMLTAITMSAMDPDNFVCDVVEKSSGILLAQDLLREGRFPPKTDPNLQLPPESGLLMRWNGRFRTKEMLLPVVDVGGEVVADLVDKYRDGMYDLENRTLREHATLVNTLKDKDGYILIVPAPRAPIWKDGKLMEQEIGARKRPDLNLSSILEAVFDYKRRTKVHPVQGIVVVVSKYDMVKDVLADQGIDLYDQSKKGFHSFMNTYFPATANKLRYFGLDKVRFFPSEVGLEVDPWPDGSPKIKVLRRRPDGSACRVPEFNESTYELQIKHLGTYAA